MMMTYFEMNGLGSANNDKNTTFTKYFFGKLRHYNFEQCFALWVNIL